MRLSKGERMFNSLNCFFMLIAAFLCLYPFLYVFARSISSESAIQTGAVILLPVELTTEGWVNIIIGTGMNRAFKFTVVLTIVGTSVNLAITIFGAYPLSKKHLRGRKIIWLLIVFTMFFSGGLIPTYLVVKTLGLIDSMWALILPGTVSTFNLIILKTFFMSIPDSLEEAAKMEGCNDINILFKIVIPLSMAIIATVTLFYSVGHWNCYTAALFYIQNTSKYPLQLKLRQITMADELISVTEESLLDFDMRPINAMKSAATIYATVPILIVYPWLQKYFVKGVLIGSLRY